MSTATRQMDRPVGRNATENAILVAARELLDEDGHERVTIEQIADRAFVSRTTIYFYFSDKQAVTDRLIHQAFAEMYVAAGPYFNGQGEPRDQLLEALGRVVGVAHRHGRILLLAAHLAGDDEHLPQRWEPRIARLVDGATARIQRDQQEGIAPDDLPAEIIAQALCAMVERHVTIEVLRKLEDPAEAARTLAELWWRAVYAWEPAAPGT